nr:MAG TPA: hypothetical protein [Inoviridae sp.]
MTQVREEVAHGRLLADGRYILIVAVTGTAASA